MKGFTKDHKFVPMTDYKKVTRKSRDNTKTQGVVIRKQRVSDLSFRSERNTSKEKKSLQVINGMGHNLIIESRLWDENSFSNNDLKNLQGWINTLQRHHDILFGKLN